MGYNMFAYCMNNPVNMSDSTGNWPRWLECLGRDIADAAKAVYSFVRKNVGGSVVIDQEITTDLQYYFIMTHETGFGYNKNFDNNKPVNWYFAIDDSALISSFFSVGIDVNVSEYGASLQIGNETSFSIRWKGASHEIGFNTYGRLYYKHCYTDKNGFSFFAKTSLNGPEIVAVALIAIYAPAVLPTLSPAIAALI